MNNKQVALSDVERYKELFEYEMTEVILQLKGEFAKVSGKDLKLEDAELSASSITLAADIPSVELESIVLQTQDTITIFGDKLAISSVTTERTSVDCPTVPIVRSISIEDVTLDKMQLDCPAANANVITNGDSVEINLPTVQTIKTDINLPMLDGVITTDKHQLQNINLMPVPTVHIVTSPEVDVQKINVSVPETRMHIKSDISVTQANVSIDVPTVSTVTQYTETHVAIDGMLHNSDSVSHEIYKPAQHIPKEVEITMPPIDVEDTFIDFGVNVGEIAVQSTVVDYPEVSKISILPLNSVITEHEKIDISTVQSMHIPMPEKVAQSKICLSDDVDVPTAKISSGTDTIVKIEKTNVNCEYSTVHSVQLSDIDITKITGVEVPEMPDFSEAIQEVLESAV